MLLTAKQLRFVHEYLIDWNGTQAAVRSGYSAKTARSIACENLKKPKIVATIERYKGMLATRDAIDRHRIIEDLAQIAFRDVPGIFHKDGTLKDPLYWPPGLIGRSSKRTPYKRASTRTLRAPWDSEIHRKHRNDVLRALRDYLIWASIDSLSLNNPK